MWHHSTISIVKKWITESNLNGKEKPYKSTAYLLQNNGYVDNDE